MSDHEVRAWLKRTVAGADALDALQDAGPIVLSVRKMLGITQRDLAERLGVSEQWVCYVEGGSKTPSADLIRRLRALVVEAKT